MDEEEGNDGQNHNYNLRERSDQSGSSSTVNRVRLNRIPGMPGIIARLIQAVTDSPGSDEDSSDDSDFDPENEIEPAFIWPSTRRGGAASLRDKSPPKPKAEWLEKLQNSDFYEETNRGLGFPLSESHRFMKGQKGQFLNVIQSREIGDIHGHRFGHYTLGVKRQLAAKLIPKYAYEQADFEAKVFCGSHSKEGEWFMSACQDQKIRIFNTSKFTTKDNKMVQEREIQARNVGWSVLDVALSPDNCHLIYSSWCDSIHQVSLFKEKGEHVALPLRADEEHRFCIFSLRFSANGDEILGGANDGYLYVYDRFAQARSLRIDAHEDDVNAVAFVDTATHILASGGDDGLVKIWDRRSLRESHPTPVGIFAGHVDGITYIDARDDARHVISNSKDQSIKLWDLRKFASNKSIEATRRAVRNQSWDYRWAHCAGRRKSSVVDDPSLMTYRGHSVFQTLIRCHFSPAFSTGQRYIITGCATGAIYSKFNFKKIVSLENLAILRSFFSL